MNQNDSGDGPSVLLVSNLGTTGKAERHWGPLADVAGEAMLVCAHADPGVEGVACRRAPSPGHRLVGIVAVFLVALAECRRGDYDAVASISLVPYGCYALALGALFGLPAHLGVIGADVDRHATARYGPLVRTAFRRFAAVSVPGTAHRERVVEMGVPPPRVSVLTNPVDVARYRPAARAETAYDFAWVGRFSAEKDPLLFVRGLAALRDRGREFEAVMVGAGELADAVERERAAAGLEAHLSLAGWVEDPLAYYRRSGAFVLTSRREGLPLSLVEAMAVGLPSVVPEVGSVTDVATHGETAYVLDERTPAALADAMETLLEDERLRRRLAAEAPAVRESHSYADAREDWRAILATMGCLDRPAWATVAG